LFLLESSEFLKGTRRDSNQDLGLEAIAKLLDTGEGCARAVVNWRSDWHPSRESQNRRPFEAQGRQGKPFEAQGKQDAGATNVTIFAT
jgi:hypothetical protein